MTTYLVIAGFTLVTVIVVIVIAYGLRAREDLKASIKFYRLEVSIESKKPRRDATRLKP